jgi:predicted NAD/FAD-dependent oxidoreductase
VHDAVVLGAGVAGLACARRLATAGADVVVLDRADKPGGRCASRLHDGEPFDYGPLFIHGSDPGFLGAVAEAGEEGRVENWPLRVAGHGTPCQAEAFAAHETRLAFTDGLTTFPRALSRDLNVRLHTSVAAVKARANEIIVETAKGESVSARDVVVAFALEQSLLLIQSLGKGAASAIALLGMFTSLPCLTVVAGYPAGTHLPDWDILYPDGDAQILLVGNESSKRPGGRSLTLVVQGNARWSSYNLERPKEEWAKELLEGAARILGPWAASPEWVHIHRWRYSRLDRANELASPLLVRLGQSRLGLAGDLFVPGGGMQAAWLSGDRLGETLSRR